jgi:hypothetical protein
MALSPPPQPALTRGTLRPLWSQTVPNRPIGLVLARERAWLFLWDKYGWLYLFNRLGVRQAQSRMDATVVAACCAEDGSAFAAVGAGGEVWWLAPDLSVRWQRTMTGPAVACAMDPFGRFLAVSDERGAMHILDNQGQTRSKVQTPRPLCFLAFVPAAPWLVASADFGLVTCYDLDGKQRWRDGLVQSSGALTVSGDGATILLACYTEGLQRYSLEGKNCGRVVTPEPCYLASISFDGRLILAGSLNSRLLVLDAEGQTLGTYPVDKPPVAVALSGFGDFGLVAIKDGQVTCLDLSSFLAR